MNPLYVVLATALITWLGLFGYVLRLEAKVNRLGQLRREGERESSTKD